MAGNGDDVARLLPSDSGICPDLRSDNDVADSLWEGVMAFLDKPIEALDQKF